MTFKWNLGRSSRQSSAAAVVVVVEVTAALKLSDQSGVLILQLLKLKHECN